MSTSRRLKLLKLYCVGCQEQIGDDGKPRNGSGRQRELCNGCREKSRVKRQRDQDAKRREERRSIKRRSMN